MTIKVITAYNGKDDGLIHHFLFRLIKYCKNHDYKLSFSLDYFSTSQYKIKYIYDNLIHSTEDYIVWIDIDIYIVNLKYKIEDLITTGDFYISSDNNGICSGFIILKRTEWNIKLFEFLNFVGKTNENVDLISCNKFGGFLFKNGTHYDQDSFKVIFNYFEQFNNKIQLINEEIIQNPETVSNKTPFAYHFWGMWNRREEVLKKIKESYSLSEE